MACAFRTPTSVVIHSDPLFYTGFAISTYEKPQHREAEKRVIALVVGLQFALICETGGRSMGCLSIAGSQTPQVVRGRGCRDVARQYDNLVSFSDAPRIFTALTVRSEIHMALARH